jgi:hypothetical protein
MSYIPGWRITLHTGALHNATHPPFGTECHQKQEFSNAKQIIDREVLPNLLVTKANYVVKPCDYYQAI